VLQNFAEATEQPLLTGPPGTLDDGGTTDSFVVAESALYKWPCNPQRLGKASAATVIGYIADILLLLASISFIGKAQLAPAFERRFWRASTKAD
jgi:hypothetical protein